MSYDTYDKDLHQYLFFPAYILQPVNTLPSMVITRLIDSQFFHFNINNSWQFLF